MSGAETGDEQQEAPVTTQEGREVAEGVDAPEDDLPEVGDGPEVDDAPDKLESDEDREAAADETDDETDRETDDEKRSGLGGALTALRVLVVLALGAGGFFLVIPVHHAKVTKVVTSRLSQLVIASPGVAGFKTKPSQSSVEPVSDIGITALTNASTKDPGNTGVYARNWEKTTKSTDAIVIFALLLPTQSEAQTVLGAVDKQVLAKNAESANSLKQTSTFEVAGIDGSRGAIYEPTKPTKTSQVTAVTAFRQGRTVALVQAAETTDTAAGRAATQAHVESVSKAQASHLQTISPSFNLVELVHPADTTYPGLASVVWIVGTLLVAFLVGIAPFWYRSLRGRREARRQAELDHMIFVRGQTITKRRR